MKRRRMNSSNTTTMQVSLSKVGLGYGIAIAVGILVLVSTIMLASYVCVRVHQTSSHGGSTSSTAAEQHSGGPDHVDASGAFADWSSSGLDQITVESYPKVVFSETKPLPHLQDTSCSICLADYKEGDMLRMLPECRHMFHAPCIDAWLRLHASCPMCRTSPLPSPLSTPISTPLSELIPLARHQIRTRS